MRISSLLLLSGGLNSSVLLHLLNNGVYGENLFVDYAMTVNYGQKAWNQEIRAANAIAPVYLPAKAHGKVDLSEATKLAKSNPLVGKRDKLLPFGAYPKQLRKNKGWVDTHVPGRNQLLITAALPTALELGCTRIYIGYSKDYDKPCFPDRSLEFLTAMNALLKLQGLDIEVRAPFANASKLDVINLAWEHRFKLGYETWNCLDGDTDHCDKCGACVELRVANKRPPTQVEVDWQERLQKVKGV